MKPFKYYSLLIKNISKKINKFVIITTPLFILSLCGIFIYSNPLNNTLFNISLAILLFSFISNMFIIIDFSYNINWEKVKEDTLFTFLKYTEQDDIYYYTIFNRLILHSLNKIPDDDLYYICKSKMYKWFNNKLQWIGIEDKEIFKSKSQIREEKLNKLLR